jgi:hypothetical protein
MYGAILFPPITQSESCQSVMHLDPQTVGNFPCQICVLSIWVHWVETKWCHYLSDQYDSL